MAIAKKYTELQKKITKVGLIYGLLIVLFCAIYFYIQHKLVSSQAEQEQLQLKVSELNSKLVNFDQRIKNVDQAVQIWKTLNRNEGTQIGIRFDDTKKIIEGMEKEFLLPTAINVSIAAPEELKDALANNKMVVMSTNGTLKVSAMSDEHFFSVVRALEQRIPGYVTITGIQLKRENTITDEALARIRLGKWPALVTGEVTFLWRDFKEEINSTNTNPEGAPPAS